MSRAVDFGTVPIETSVSIELLIIDKDRRMAMLKCWISWKIVSGSFLPNGFNIWKKLRKRERKGKTGWKFHAKLTLKVV